MGIGSFTQLTGSQGVNLDSVISQGKKGKLELQEPLNPPGKWTRFKAALSELPLLGNIGALRKARTEVEEYPVKLEKYQVTNRQVLSGFVKDLRSEYGNDIAEMTLRNVGVQDGEPLTARTVSTALEGAKRAQQHCKSQNNQMVTRLLESPSAGGARLRGEQDMNDVFLESGLKLDGKSGWQEVLGPGAAKFVTQQVMERCRSLPGYAQGTLTNEQVVDAMKQALALYQEVRNAPGMTPARLDAIFTQAAEKGDAKSCANFARELAIMDQVSPMLDRRNPDSMLRKESEAIARRHGLPPLPDLVLKCISNNVSEHITVRSSEGLQKDLGTAGDPSSILGALKPKLEENVRRALDEHCQALKLIDESTTLTPAQKEHLRSIANERRIDPVQVREYEKMAAVLGPAMKGLAGCEGDPGRALEQFRKVQVAFEGSVNTMQLHGGEFWERGSIRGGDGMLDLLKEFAQFTVAGMPKEEAQPLLEALTGPSMKDMVAGMGSSPSFAISYQWPTLLGKIIEGVALRAGVEPEKVGDLARETTSVEARKVGELNPGLALQVMTMDKETVDSRGVVVGSKTAKDEIRKEFRYQSLVPELGKDIIEHAKGGGVDEARGVSSTFVRDTDGARFNLNGKELPKHDTERILGAMDDAFPDTEDGRRMKLALSQCMNQRGLNAFAEVAKQRAIGEGNFMITKTLGTQYEAFAQEDGSWIVRSTNIAEPRMIDYEKPQVQPDGTTLQQKELAPGGVALFSVTYRITPNPGGEPVISLTDSHVAFDF